MKSLFLAVVLTITSFNLFAGEPKVGDYATYSFTTNGFQGTSKNELTSFDAASNSFVKTVTTTFNGQTQSQSETVRADELSSTDQLQALLALCEDPNVGGTIEQISITAGSFTSCRLNAQQGGTVNMAVVPFGVATVNTADLTMELIDYSFAK